MSTFSKSSIHSLCAVFSILFGSYFSPKVELLTISHWKWMSKTLIKLFFKTLLPMLPTQPNSSHPSAGSSQAQASPQVSFSAPTSSVTVRHKCSLLRKQVQMPRYRSQIQTNMKDWSSISTTTLKSTTPIEVCTNDDYQDKTHTLNLEEHHPRIQGCSNSLEEGQIWCLMSFITTPRRLMQDAGFDTCASQIHK